MFQSSQQKCIFEYLYLRHFLLIFKTQCPSLLAHYSKSQIFVQKFNFDKTPTFARDFHSKFFLTIFLVKSKLSTAKKSKTPTFSRVFHSKFFRAQRRWRKAVTGDPDKRIRDYMIETPQVKMLDKVSFTLGVIVICLSEWLILRQPNLFPYFYYAIMAVLMAYRYYDYASQKGKFCPIFQFVQFLSNFQFRSIFQFFQFLFNFQFCQNFQFRQIFIFVHFPILSHFSISSHFSIVRQMKSPNIQIISA